MKQTAYLRTQDNRLIAVPTHEDDGDPHFTDAEISPHCFNLVNTLKAPVMREVRALAQSAGTRLRKPDTMALR